MLRNESGQVIAEFSLTTLLITLPLIAGGGAWFKWEFNKASAAYQSFAQARQQLIETEAVSEVPVQVGDMKETVKLIPLEDLDQGEHGLAPSDLGGEVSQLSADALHSYQRLQALASTILSKESTISQKLKSLSTGAPASSSSN